VELYFAYGSNLDIDQVKQRCPDESDIRKIAVGYLPEHRLAFTQFYPDWGGGVADVISSPNSKVWGILYELSLKALECLDQFEGYPTDYTRIRHTIMTLDGKSYEGWVYSVVRKDGEFIPPSKRYMDIIKRNAKDAGFPQEYLSYLNSIRTV
jgi:gamma-glutamylcyclotransferase (GGCT)/AIG2-like uncharacterized protein YtfP